MQNNETINHLFLPEHGKELISGIPWAFPKPEEQLAKWSFLTQNYFSFEQNNIKALQASLNNNEFQSPTKEKIQKFIKDKSAHLKSLSKVLDPFLKKEQKVKIDSFQNILAYQDLIFRDWSWGKHENKVYLDYILKSLKGDEKNILVLGAGACGLSHQLAQNSKANIIATDINPYLFLSSQKLFNGKTLKLGEFNDYPSSIEHYSYMHEFDKIESCRNHFQVFCDFGQLPFKPGSFDAVVSPWFYDIVDHELPSSLGLTNDQLNDAGINIFIGPSNFHKGKISKSKTTEEILENFGAHYEVVSSEKRFCPYLDNPKVSQKRTEEVLFITASKKIKTETKQPIDNHQIKLTPSLIAYRQKVEVFSKILKHVGDNQSYEQLALKLESEFNFSHDEALYYAKSFMQKIYQEL